MQKMKKVIMMMIMKLIILWAENNELLQKLKKSKINLIYKKLLKIKIFNLNYIMKKHYIF